MSGALISMCLLEGCPERGVPLCCELYSLQFYFGDRNFPKDKFLQQTVESSTDGCIQPHYLTKEFSWM